MTQAIHPSDAMQSFEQALRSGDVSLLRGELDPLLLLRADHVDGVGRFSYARVDGETVTAFVNFMECKPIDGAPCLNLGCAVPESHRNEGRGREAIAAAIADLSHRFAADGVDKFYVETFVRADNLASRRLAERTVSPESTPIADPFSGEPAFRYLREVWTSKR